MNNPWSPSHEEIATWAFDATTPEPAQDWDLGLVQQRQHEALYIQLAGDDACPKRRYFLRLLYLMVGEAVRNGYRSVPKPLVAGFVDLAESNTHSDIKRWQRRSRELLHDESRFSYADWCGGALAEKAV